MPSRPVRIVTQGPSEPVRVVTQGIADPVRIISGTPSDPVRVVTSGISTPIRIVAGSILNLPDVESSTRLLDLQADALVLSDGDPIGTWADASGQGHDFTQTGSAQPTMQSVDGYKTARFDGIDDSMNGQDWAELDNLPSFTIFCVAVTPDQDNFVGSVIYKIHSLNLVPADAIGWGVGGWGTVCDVEQLFPANSSYTVMYLDPIPNIEIKHVYSLQVREWNNDVSIYVDGSNANNAASLGGIPVVSISNHYPVMLGTTGDPTNDGYATMDLYSVMFYAPAPNDADRAAIEDWLATKYGIAL